MAVGPLRSTLRMHSSNRSIVEQSARVVSDAACLVSPVVARGFDIWSAARSGAGVPPADGLKAEQLQAILPYVYLVDVVGGDGRETADGPPDFRYRLVGTDVVAHTEADNTGRLLSDIARQGSQATLIRLYELAIEQGQPAVQRIPYRSRRGSRHWYETIVMPMATGPDGRIDRLLGVAEHFCQSV
ncbi:MAG: PAS domain-containing protein [Thalassobaculaceae bacterium]